MGLWSVLFMSAMPVFRLMVHCGIGAYLSSPKSNVMPADARKHINKLVFVCFMPSLVFSNLAQTVTVEKMLEWWFMPINVLLCYVIGAGIGICIYDYYKPPPHLRRLIIACCATGNSSNLPLVLMSAICVEAGSPFGNFDICLANGVAYISYGLWMSTVLTWTVVFNYLKPPPGDESHAKQLQDVPATDNRPPGQIEPRHEPQPYSMPQGGYHQGFMGGEPQAQAGGYRPTSRFPSPHGYGGFQDFSQPSQGYQDFHTFQTFQPPRGPQDYEHGSFVGPGTFPSPDEYGGGGSQRGYELDSTQGFSNANFQNYRSSPEPQPFNQGFQAPQPRMQGYQPSQNDGFHAPGQYFPDSNNRFQARDPHQGFPAPQSRSQSPPPTSQALVPGAIPRPESPVRIDDFSIANLKLLAEKYGVKEAFTPPTTAAAIAIPIGAVPFFRHLLYGHQAPFRFVGDALAILGEAMVPCMNLLLGGNLSQSLGTSELALEVVICVMLTRLLLLPMAGLVVVKLAFSMGLVPADPLFHFVLLLQFTMPTAINIGTMTQLFGVGQTESSIILFWCYSCSIVFLTLWTMIFLVLLI